MSGFAVRTYNAQSISIPSEPREQDFCACAIRCAWTELAFAGSTDYTNDKTSFLFRKLRSSDTVDIDLLKDGVKVADLDNDTYGTFYNGFTAQPNYVGYLVDWGKVEANLGGGYYTVFTTLTQFGATVTFQSHQYRVIPFTEELAQDTVKIESFQSGNILDSQFDFRGLVDGGWYQSIRLPGRFFFDSVDKEEDRYLNSARRLVQNYETSVRNYQFISQLIPDDIEYRLASYENLANRLLVSGYDLLTFQPFERLPVIMTSLSKGTDSTQGYVTIEAEFKDLDDTLIKRNV